MTQRSLRFALFGNVYQSKKSDAIGHVLSCLRASGAELLVDWEYYNYLRDVERLDVSWATAFCGSDFEADFAISMGGDGTFLQTAGRVGRKNIPILGIHVGRLGFLADIQPQEVEQWLQALAAGDYVLEDRAMIAVSASGGDGGGDVHFALNDVAVLKRDTASMISIRTHINGEYLMTYQADGLIVSTPTGSTAYALSNGGPIIAPGTGVLLMTAVAPHSLNVRPIVIADTAEITLDVGSRSHNFLVAVDGRAEKYGEGTRITLRRAPYNVRVVKRMGNCYFATLREKMMWGADGRDV